MNQPSVGRAKTRECLTKVHAMYFYSRKKTTRRKQSKLWKYLSDRGAIRGIQQSITRVQTLNEVAAPKLCLFPSPMMIFLRLRGASSYLRHKCRDANRVLNNPDPQGNLGQRLAYSFHAQSRYQSAAGKTTLVEPRVQAEWWLREENNR